MLVALDFVKKHPNSSLSYETLGWAYLKQGDLQAALQEYERGLEIEPLAPTLLAGQGAVLSRLGRHREAIAAFNTVTTEVPDFMEREENEEFGQYFTSSWTAIKEQGSN